VVPLDDGHDTAAPLEEAAAEDEVVVMAMDELATVEADWTPDAAPPVDEDAATDTEDELLLAAMVLELYTDRRMAALTPGLLVLLMKDFL